MKNKKAFSNSLNKKLCNLLNELAEEHFKEECKHPKKYLRELPNQENVRPENREAKCLKCGAVLVGYINRD